MALITKQHLYYLNKNLQTLGCDCVFQRCGVNSFNEPTDEMVTVHECKGIFKIKESGFNITVVEAGTIKDNAQTTTILTILYTDDVKMEDVVFINGHKFKIVGMNNVALEDKILYLNLEDDAYD